MIRAFPLLFSLLFSLLFFLLPIWGEEMYDVSMYLTTLDEKNLISKQNDPGVWVNGSSSSSFVSVDKYFFFIFYFFFLSFFHLSHLFSFSYLPFLPFPLAFQ